MSEIKLFAGKLEQTPTPYGQKMMFEAVFIMLLKKIFNTYMRHFGKLPKGFTDMQRVLPKIKPSPDVLHLSNAILQASLRGIPKDRLAPILYTIVFAACAEIVKHSNVYTTTYAHKGIGYLAQSFIDKHVAGKDAELVDSLLYEEFGSFGNVVRSYVEGEAVEVISLI